MRTMLLFYEVSIQLTSFGMYRSWIRMIGGKSFFRIRFMCWRKSWSILTVASTLTCIKVIDKPLMIENICSVCVNESRENIFDAESILNVDSSLVNEMPCFLLFLTWNTILSFILIAISLTWVVNVSTVNKKITENLLDYV